MARIPVRMPKMSMTMTEGEVGTWFVKVGDEVAEGDVVCEVMTDKVDMEVESTASGVVVEIAVEEGLVPVGEPIAWLEGEPGPGFGDLLSEEPAETVGEASTSSLDEPLPDTVVPEDAVAATVPRSPEAPPATEQRPTPAVPRARALAREHGVDLRTVSGTGPEGLVRVEDVRARVPVTTQAPAGTATPPASARRTSMEPQDAEHRTRPQRDRSAVIRSAVARKMVESAAVPQFTVWRDINLEEADTHRRGISWTTILLRSYAAALREVPELLCRWQDGLAAQSGPPAVALAVATEGGLLVPVFGEPDRANPESLDREIRSVVAAAHAGRLDPAYLGVANAALSNLGGMGVDRFQALVTPPQASVLALGSIGPRPVAVPGGVGVALSLTAGLTVDHRVADGAHAARLLDAFTWNVTAHAD
jgi:pyruvate dehydrogenase E2 component (dihydrolipoamide acetyltransferase)